MTEQDYHKISELLTRREAQREYLRHQRENISKCEQSVTTHWLEIQHLQRRLKELGYKGQ